MVLKCLIWSKKIILNISCLHKCHYKQKYFLISRILKRLTKNTTYYCVSILLNHLFSLLQALLQHGRRYLDVSLASFLNCSFWYLKNFPFQQIY